MTALPLHPALKAVADALETASKMPAALWEGVEVEELLKLVRTHPGTLGDMHHEVFSLALTAWKKLRTEATMHPVAAPGGDSSEMHRVAEKLDSMTTSGPVNSVGLLKTSLAYMHGVVPTTRFQQGVLAFNGLANFPREISWDNEDFLLTPGLWCTHPDMQKRHRTDRRLQSQPLEMVSPWLHLPQKSP